MTSSNGWPGHKGPIDSLNKIGLWPNRTEYPTWIRSPHLELDLYGRESYMAGAAFLSDTALRALAALTFEGWNVFIDSTDLGLKFKITRKSKTHA